ncbi:site-specific DNA-methyltransferase [Nitrosococcus watsonii]|uniref:site-specific DNA-methyltransferase (adenine-specific) n=1 Tax=Nitrosococcus watsoni (strain C-113) TaxID=105559 RepID=D8K6K0_NITWC|nr:site-specific DNA-methyltransferase [Nitrosococcus watsonii]ADJ28527.1 DNA methylase N-4/N-6 domain protein [Nitrosococcus watsonii C-113]
MARKKITKKRIETLTHDDAARVNIPTAEYEAMLHQKDKSPIPVPYKRRNRDLDPQLVWRGKDEQDWSDLVVHAPPLYIQEKVHPKALIDDLRRQSVASGERSVDREQQLDLFADFNGLPDEAAKTEFYQHEAHWSNRMILGDSLQVMASLAEREGLRGKVQCIYFDPPYGIKFNSNFQWSTTSRDVKDGNVQHITREPEQVKAFRDTWRDGIHSYLTYLRDRLTVARDLLTDSGSIFVQIGDENVHRVRALMDEVFGDVNFVSEIVFQKTGSQPGSIIGNISDYILWFAKRKQNAKVRNIFLPKDGGEGDFSPDPLTSDGASEKGTANFYFQGQIFHPGKKAHWKTTLGGMEILARAGRIIKQRKQIRLRKYWVDNPVKTLTNIWTDSGGASNVIYVVQTNEKIPQRCLLMSTDPGDLVLDPTCGSGTTAYVAEQWGRRWITIDTSRVALALARSRIMGARYPYYLLVDSKEGVLKEAEITRTAPSTKPTTENIRYGFVYERVPHITLKSIANNAEIDVIWDNYHEKLEPLLRDLSRMIGEKWIVTSRKASHASLSTDHSLAEWEVPREFPADWPEEAKTLHQDFWRARVARQREIDASIAAKADFEYLYDKPYEDKNKVRVAGPFTVESISPHRALTVGADDELIDPAHQKKVFDDEQDFAQIILENLKTAGVQQAHKDDKINFISLTPWPGELVCAEGVFEAANGQPTLATHHQPPTTQQRAAIFIGPEFGTVSRPDLVRAAREAADGGFDVLIACAFNYDAHSTEFEKLGRVPVLKARMNADLHMADDLKNTGKGNLFVIFGEPDVEVVSGQWLVASDGGIVVNYAQCQKLSGLGSLEKINELGRTDLQYFKVLSAGDSNGGAQSNRTANNGDQLYARWPQAVAAIEALTEVDFPLSLTTDHYAQVTLHGVDVFHPNTGEVRSDDADGIACWFIDTDYNEESFFVRQAYFLSANDPYKSLKTTLKAEINQEAWETLNSDISRPFKKPRSGRIAVKVINHLGDEVMKVYKI